VTEAYPDYFDGEYEIAPGTKGGGHFQWDEIVPMSVGAGPEDKGIEAEAKGKLTPNPEAEAKLEAASQQAKVKKEMEEDAAFHAKGTVLDEKEGDEKIPHPQGEAQAVMDDINVAYGAASLLVANWSGASPDEGRFPVRPSSLTPSGGQRWSS
jgi:hypothetical protein